ncbi:MAG TPA: tetratricopeptide repeat protein [Mucilaginibacter sp.]|nr:tetratricopeptide repeat protein [Mucilaginibacter sp.]
MRWFRFITAVFFTITLSGKLFAQGADDARALVKEGQKLVQEKKFTEAIAKYQAALKIDSTSLFADYQLAYALFLNNRGNEGIAYLNKIVNTDSKISSAAYELLGLIYFKNHEYEKAEESSVAAIKSDPLHASTQRMYALVSFHQDKRAQALLAFCSFILLEPNTARSKEAFGNIGHILQGGALKLDAGEHTPVTDANTESLNKAITQAVAEFAGRRYKQPADLLSAQLTAIFTNIGKIAAEQSGNDFFRNYLAAFFYKLAQSDNMPAFARLVSQSDPSSAKWISENPQQMADLQKWVTSTERNF